MNGGSASPEDSYKVYVDDSIGKFIILLRFIYNIYCFKVIGTHLLEQVL